MSNIVQTLKESFITSPKAYQEGDVFGVCQQIELEGLVKADLYMTALGVYEAEINGEKIGEQIFAPGYTYYPRDLFYQKYDVLQMLKNGKSNLEVYVGQGWYCGRFTFKNKCQIYGEKQAVGWALEWENEKGERGILTSREGVKEISTPYKYAGFYDGEVYDEQGAGTETGAPVIWEGKVPEHLEETYTGIVTGREVKIQSVQQKGSDTVIDFGENFAGYITIDPTKLPERAVIKVLHGEILNPDGTVYTTNLRKAKAEIVYTKGKRFYRPRFTYMGFRYIQISGAGYQDGMIRAYAIHNKMERTGTFTSGNEMVNQLYENTIRGQLSNYVEIPTDCPQRDERMGYTGDGQVFARTGSYHFDTREFFRKFLKDIRYSQMDNSEGYIPSTVPAEGPAGIGFLSMLGWGNAVTIIPNLLYELYGETRFLEEQYDSMKQFVDMEIRHMKKNLWISPSLGDWLMPGKSMAWQAMHNGPVSNSFIVNDLRILSRAARMFGKEEDAVYYGEQFEKTKAAYQKKFIKKNGKMKDNYQGAYLMALRYVVDEEPLRNMLLEQVIQLIEKNGMDTGFFSTEFLLPTLADAGRSDLAYNLLLSEKLPGWMYEIKRGATTIWERWDAIKEDGTVNEAKSGGDNMVSFNHYAFGSVAEFYYEYILGIKPVKPGFEEICIRPYPDQRLKKVEGSYQSVAGLIKSAWEYKEDKIEFRITVPKCAVILLPGKEKQTVEAGEYCFTTDLL